MGVFLRVPRAQSVLVPAVDTGAWAAGRCFRFVDSIRFDRHLK